MKIKESISKIKQLYTFMDVTHRGYIDDLLMSYINIADIIDESDNVKMFSSVEKGRFLGGFFRSLKIYSKGIHWGTEADKHPIHIEFKEAIHSLNIPNWVINSHCKLKSNSSNHPQAKKEVTDALFNEVLLCLKNQKPETFKKLDYETSK